MARNIGINAITLTNYEPPSFGPEDIGFLHLTHEWDGVSEYTIQINRAIAETKLDKKIVFVDFHGPLGSGLRKILRQNYLSEGWKKVQWTKQGSVLKLFA